MNDSTSIISTLPDSNLLQTKWRGLIVRLLVLGITVMLVSQVIISWIALDGFEKELRPELNQKAFAVGRAISSEIAYAINDLGIPADQLVRVDGYFEKILESNLDLVFLALADPTSRILFEHNLPPIVLNNIQTNPYKSDSLDYSNQMLNIEGYLDGQFPIHLDGRLQGVLHVGVSDVSLRQQLSVIFYEVIPVIAVSMLITLEFLMLFMSLRISEPMSRIEATLVTGAKGLYPKHITLPDRTEIGLMVTSLNRMLYNFERRYQDFQFEMRELREAQIDKQIGERIAKLSNAADKKYRFTITLDLISRSPALIRIPLFLFIFSEEMSRSFFPLFVSGFLPIQTVLSHDVMIGLPITLFMAATIFATLFAGGLAYRYGSPRVFLIGISCAIFGYIGTFYSDSYFQMIGWRCLNGVGYGLIFVACETWVALHAVETNRAQSASSFVGAIFAGFVCGPPIGGMFADYVGLQTTFLISAVLAAVSGYIAYRLLLESEQVSGVQPMTPRRLLSGFREWRILFGDFRFVGVLLTSVPTKITLSAFLYFLIPLYLNSLGYSNSQIGQLIMLYGLLAVVCTPFISHFADRSGQYSLIITLGGILSGLGLIITASGDLFGGVTIAVLISIITVGIGHSFIISSQNAIVQEIAHSYRSEIGMPMVLGICRLIDRLGMVIGPILAAVLISKLSYTSVISSIGGFVIFTALLFWMIIIFGERVTQTKLQS